MRSTSCTPSSISIKPASGLFWPTTPRTVRVTPEQISHHVHAEFEQGARRQARYRLARRRSSSRQPWLLYPPKPNPHLTSARPFHRPPPAASRLRARRVFAVHDAPFEPPGLVDDALEQPADGVRAKRPFGGDLAHVRQHVFRCGDGPRSVPCSSRRSRSQDAPRPLVQEPDKDLIHPIDVPPQIIQIGHRFYLTLTTPPRRGRRS